MSSEEKTEKPTDHKIRESRKRGELAFSRDLTAAAVFLVVCGFLWLGFGFVRKHLAEVFDAALGVGFLKPADFADGLMAAAAQMLTAAVWIVVPLLLIAAATSLLVGLLQTRGNFSTEPLKLKFERMNPGSALKNLFSSKQFGVLLQLILKFALLGGIIYQTIKIFLSPLVMEIYDRGVPVGTVTAAAFRMLFGSAAMVFLVLGTLDFAQQYFEYIKQNRMGKSEVKRENKEQDGDPHLKAEIRTRRREIMESPVNTGMGRAQVLVTNPTHYAVALYYDPDRVDLPVVVAKGEDQVALHMRTEAGLNAIPVLENPPLARSLHAKVELGGYIGDEHLEAVAEIFRWLAQLRKQTPAETT